jgi:hypothetical protein
MPCRAHAVPVPCHDHAVLKATSQGHDTARHGHGMGELASAALRRHMGDLSAFGFFRLQRGVISEVILYYQWLVPNGHFTLKIGSVLVLYLLVPFGIVTSKYQLNILAYADDIVIALSLPN